MLEVKIPGKEWYDEYKEEFITTKPVTLILEHSLLSLSKWESKWKKPYFNDKRTLEESIDYIRCMTINGGIDPMVYYSIPADVFEKIQAYIDDPMTATTVTHHVGKARGRRSPVKEIITSELIYYWMTQYNIPFSCEKWHLNRLMTLIQVCAAKSNGDKKMSQKDVLKQNAALNAARKAKHHTKG